MTAQMILTPDDLQKLRARIDRVVAGNLLRNCRHAQQHEGLIRVCPHKLAELCRVWLAVDGAPIGEVSSDDGDVVLAGFPTANRESLVGQSVRLVPVTRD